MYVTILIFTFQETHTGRTDCHLLVRDADGIMDGMKYAVKEMVSGTTNLYIKFFKGPPPC
jgi:hypothetical protein